MSLPWINKDHEHVRKLIALLNKRRTYVKASCFEVGQLLYNLTMDRTYYNDWVVWYNNQTDNITDSIWQQFRCDKTLDLNTLCYWAQMDNPDGFKKIQYQIVESLVESALKPFLSYQTNRISESIVSQTIHLLFVHEIAYVPHQDQFYLFRGHSWNKVDTNALFKNYLFPDLIEYFNTYFRVYDRIHNKRYYRALRAFRSLGFQQKIINQCKNLFNSTNYRFDLKLESNSHLICFTNGVYDTRENCFRGGRPGDYCYYTTKYQYQCVIPAFHHQKVQILTEILTSIIMDASERHYLLSYLSLALEGYREQSPFPQKFCQIWLGLSGDGRKFLAELIRYTFGDYVSTGSRLVVLEDSEDPETFDDDYLFYLLERPRSIWLRSVGLQNTVITETPVVFVPFYASSYVQSTYTYRRPTEFYQEFMWLLLNNYRKYLTVDDLNRPVNFVRYNPTVHTPEDKDLLECADTLISFKNNPVSV